MNAYHLTIAATAAGLLLATNPASATPLAPTAPAPMGIERLDGAVEPVHYRKRAVRRHSHRHPTISFGFGPAVTPYYAYPYRYSYYPYHTYRYPYAYPYAYHHGVAPGFSFGFHIGR